MVNPLGAPRSPDGGELPSVSVNGNHTGYTPPKPIPAAPRRLPDEREVPVVKEMEKAAASAPPPAFDAPNAAPPGSHHATVHDAPPDESGYLLHDILKGLEVSFGIEAAQVEREAVDVGRQWAQSGLPRHDIQPAGKLEPEEALEQRARGVFAEWCRRVRTRLADAVAGEAEKVSAAVLLLEQQVMSYRVKLDQLRGGHRDLLAAITDDEARARELANGPRRRIAYGGTMGMVAFWLLIGLLTMCDFFANAPVFQELLPSSAYADRVIEEWEADNSESPWSYGVGSLFARLVVHLDATILALGVVVFLVFLADVAGKSARTLVATHATDVRLSADLLHDHRRRPVIPLLLGITGILATILVLYVARARIEPMAEARLALAAENVARADSGIAAAREAQDATLLDEWHARRIEALKIHEARDKRLSYAKAIAAMNTPVMFLNFVLVFCAALAGYLKQSENMEYDAAPPRKADAARERLQSARQAVESQRALVCDTMNRLDGAIQRVRYLAGAGRFVDPSGKADRLRRVVPLFRSENARSRGLDPRDILAFRTFTPLDLPPADLSQPVQVPEKFAEGLERREAAEREFRTLERDREALSEALAA